MSTDPKNTFIILQDKYRALLSSLSAKLQSVSAAELIKNLEMYSNAQRMLDADFQAVLIKGKDLLGCLHKTLQEEADLSSTLSADRVVCRTIYGREFHFAVIHSNESIFVEIQQPLRTDRYVLGSLTPAYGDILLAMPHELQSQDRAIRSHFSMKVLFDCSITFVESIAKWQAYDLVIRRGTIK